MNAGRTRKEPWVVFTHQGKELAAYTVRGTFPGEMKATKELLAAENGCRQEDIETRIERSPQIKSQAPEREILQKAGE